MIRSWLVIATAATLVATFSAWPVMAQEKRPSSRDVSNLIDEFCAGAVTAERKIEIIEMLRHAPAARLVHPLARRAAADGFGPNVSELLVKLKHPQSWEILREHLAGPSADLALDVLFQIGTEPVVDQLRNRWRTEPPGSVLFELLTEGFVDYAPSVPFFVRFLDDAARGEAARKIVATSLELPLTAPAAELNAAWAKQSTAFPIQGLDLLKTAQFEGEPIVSRGPNFVLRSGQSATSLDITRYQNHNHTVTVRFFALATGGTDGPRIGYETDQGVWELYVRENRVFLRTATGNDESVELRQNEWNTITFSVRVIDFRQRQRSLWIAVNGTRYMNNRPVPFHGAVKSLFARSRAGRLLVGGWDVRQD